MSTIINNIYSGAISLTGLAIDVTKVGFKPRLILIICGPNGDLGLWFDGMADASVFKKIAGAGSSSLATANGITPLVQGFTWGADSDLNTSGEVGYFVAIA